MKLISALLFVIFIYGCASPAYEKVDLKSVPVHKDISVERTRGSIWPGENSRNRFFADFRARDVGDMVTITISEKTAAKGEATTSTSRDTSENAAVTNLFGAPLDLKIKDFMNMGNSFSPTAAGTHVNKLDGKGTTERKGEITATIAARITEVLANGNLYIEGKKETMVNKEKQHIIISGIVRPEDIKASNTVSSDSISDLRLELSGYGVITDKQSPGWLTRILDNIWPF